MPSTQQTLADLLQIATDHPSNTRYNVRESKLVKVVVDGLTEASPYAPGNPGDWDGDPATIQDALDRLAAAVSGLLTAPIP